MAEYTIPEFTIERARAHVEAGERLLVSAADEYSDSSHMGDGVPEAALASAHFAAASAITNILLTDPPEMPEPLVY